MNKKKRKKIKSPAKQSIVKKSSGPSSISESVNYDILWMGLSLFHVLILIYCLTAVANFNNPSIDDETAPKTEREKLVAEQKSIKPIRPIATPIAASYGIFTSALWLAMLFLPNKPTGSAGRFLIMMIAPGTLMAVFAVLQIFIYP